MHLRLDDVAECKEPAMRRQYPSRRTRRTCSVPLTSQSHKPMQLILAVVKNFHGPTAWRSWRPPPTAPGLIVV